MLADVGQGVDCNNAGGGGKFSVWVVEIYAQNDRVLIYCSARSGRRIGGDVALPVQDDGRR